MEQLEDTEAVKDWELLPVNLVKRNAEFPLLYVTASINHGGFHQNFIIGDGSSSTDPILQTTFYNIPLQKEFTYYYFIRAYSAAHTREVSLNFSIWLLYMFVYTVLVWAAAYLVDFSIDCVCTCIILLL